MSRSRLLVVGAGLLAAGAFLVSLGGGPRALAKGKDEHIRYQPSYAAAVQEAKSRNAVIFATFHKDNWGGCKAQHRSVLENKKFVEWANENLVVVVGHTEKEHPAEVEDERGEKTPGCSLYPGMTCEQHQAITGECMRGADDLPKIEVANTMPNSWLVSPTGEVVKIEPVDQQVAGKIQELVEAMQKTAGRHLTWKKFEKYQEDFGESDKALEAGELKDAIKALQKVEKDAKKLPDGMNAEVDRRVEAINAKAMEQFETIKADEDVGAAVKAANKLKTDVGLRFKRGYLPVVEEIKTWLKEAKSAAK